MDQILSNLGDGAVPAALLLLALRFWTQFRSLLGLLKDAGDWSAAQVRLFASRTIVIMTRPIWRVILPVMVVVALASTVSLFIGCIHLMTWWSWGWLVVGVIAKCVAIGLALGMRRRVHNVRTIDQTDTRLNGATQAQVDGWYGEAWLFMPMISTAFWTLASVSGAVLVDVFVLADHVGLYHSLFQVVLFIGMLIFTLSFLVAVLAVVALFVNAGVELGGGGWSGFIVPVATAVLPVLTRNNNKVLMIQPETRKAARDAVWEVLVDNRFAGGVVAAWILWFLSFHSPTAWLIELVFTIALVAVLLTYVWITRKVLIRMAENIVIIICAGGLGMIIWRVIDAAVGPNAAEISAGLEHEPVLFYHRFGWLLSYVGSWFGGVGSTDPVGWTRSVIPTFIFCLFLFAGVAFYFSRKLASGTAHTVLTALAVALAILGGAMVLIRTAVAETPRPETEETADENDDGLDALRPEHTVNAGSHDMSRDRTCHMTSSGTCR